PRRFGNQMLSRWRFIVTRPEAETRAMAQRLESAGHEGGRAPLLAIRARPGGIPRRHYRAGVVTSANGARGLADHPDRPRRGGGGRQPWGRRDGMSFARPAGTWRGSLRR